MKPNAQASRAAALALTIPILLSPLTAPGSVAEERWRGLRGLTHVQVMVALAEELPGFPLEVIVEHVKSALRQSPPAPRVDQGSAEILRVALMVRRINATELRGFWLPFSGDYGIGTVRLSMERPVRLGEAPISSVSSSATARDEAVPVPAIVWQAERLARGPWSASGAQGRGLLKELLDEFLADFRRASVAPGR